MSTLALIGPPGSGKTSVGTEIAKELNWSFTDLDEQIEASDAVVLDEGSHALRERALRALRAALTDLNPHGHVIAVSSVLAGGDDLHELLDDVYVVYLDSDLAHTFPRAGLSGPHSVGLIGTRALWRAMLEERDATYRQLADSVVEVGDLSIRGVAEAVILTMPCA